MRGKMMLGSLTFGVVIAGSLALALTANAAYESAEYEVVEKDGKIEIRQYPELILASTESKVDAQGRDGSFLRLFRYISGSNEDEQKIAMTTPVFMEESEGEANGKMGFVVPKKVAEAGTPKPTAADVTITKRPAGKFAVIQFSGRMNSKLAKEQEAELREWMANKELVGETTAETAGYNSPFVPGPLRRNEVLIRLKTAD
jgi:hypothetical protein